jgi:hypothetical protein
LNIRDAEKRNIKIPDGHYFLYKKIYNGKRTEGCSKEIEEDEGEKGFEVDEEKWQ